jgi:uncharacterized membrane protein YgaE (UPF0421/DUF939 family)
MPLGAGFSWSSARALLTRLRGRSRATLRDRWDRVRVNVVVAVQAGFAAGLAWFVAADVLKHQHAFFAPIAAVITLAGALGERLQRAIEIVVGVAVGIAVGDLLILAIGTGPWQVGLVVTLAFVAAVFVGGTPALVSQAGASAVLVATLAPPTGGVFYVRFIDALVGGAVALVAMALLLPANPLAVVSRAGGQALVVLADGLADTGAALAAGDTGLAQAAQTRLGDGEADLTRFQQALPAGRESATLAPLRWTKKEALAHYVEAADDIVRVMRNARVLTRRTVTLLGDREPVPETLPAAVKILAEAVHQLRRELASGARPDKASDLAVRAVHDAAAAYQAGLGFSGNVVVAQVRTIATDLLRTAGLSHDEANRLVRRAGGAPR